MQKGKGSTASPSAVVLSGRPPQSAPRGVPQPQPRPEEFNQGSRQSYQNIGGPMPQALVVGPGPMPGQLQTQGQPRLPNQQPFYHGQGRPIRIQRHHNPQNQPMYSSPPGGHMLPIFPPGAAQFISQQQNPQFMQQHVDFSQIPMTAPPQVQYRTQQPMQGQFPPTSGPPQPQGHFGYPQQPMYPMAQPPSNVYFVRAPAPQMSGIQPLQTPNYQEPRTRERKIIQIKDPSSNKDVTQEILQGGHSSGPSVTGSTGGTPNTTPDVSGHSSSSSTPPLTLQQQAEANVRAQFAAQVAATLATNAEEKALSQAIKPGEVTIQKPVVKPVVVDTVKTKEVQEPPLVQKDEVVTKTELSESVNVATEVQSIEQPSKEQQMETKEVVEDSKVEEVAVTVSISTESQSAVQLSEVSKADIGTSDKKADAAPAVVDVAKVLSNEPEQSSSAASGILMSEGEPTAPEENAQQATSETAPVIEDKVLNGPVSLSKEEEEEEETKEEVKEEEVVGVKNDTEVEAPPVPEVAEPATVEEVAESKEQPAVEPQAVVEESEDLEVLPTAMETEDSASAKRVNGHEPDVKSSAASKNPAEGKVDMKKKKQKHRLKDIEKRSSEKESDMMDAYTERPVKEEVPVDAEGNAAEVTEQKGGEEEVEVEEPQSEEETWEDKEETWSQLEGESDGKLTYERDFLLQFQYNPLCTLKPEGLPDLEVVLGTARAPPKPGYQSNRMPNSGGGGDMFLPGFMRSNSRTNPQNPRGGRSRPPPKKVITLPTKPTEVDLKRSDNRWVRPNDVPKTEDLYRKVRSILNKLTPQKFQTLTQQIIDLDIDTAERLEGVIDLIFEKAIDEPGFSVAYANMCRCLIPKKVVVEKDGKELAVTFRKILLNKCQKEFEKEKSVEKIIHEKLEDLSNKGLTDEERAQKKEEIREEETKAKRRTLGNIRFIGELFKLKMLTESIMHDCVVKLLRSNDEESFECLCKLLVTIGKDLDHEKAKPRVDQYFNQIGKIISARITSSRVRFMMQDIEELRSNKWVPRREDNNPKTIDQIHKEAADEAKKTQMIIQQAKQENKRQRGNIGGRDSPRPSAAAAGEETWTTVGRGPRNMSVDPKKFQNIKQRPVDSENISLGPGGRGYGAWARGSSGGTGAVGAGAGSSAAAAATATAAAEPDSRPTGNRYSALAGERRSSAPSRQNSGGAGRQEPRSPVSTGGRRGPPGPAGDREKALEAVRAMSQPKRNNQEREAGRESPKLAAETPAAAAAVAASEAPASVAAATTPTGEPELTSEEMQKKAVAIIDEYLNIKDMKEAVLCVKDLQSPSTHHEFVSTAFNHTMEKKVSDRNATGKLMHSLLREGVLETEQYLKGIEEIFELGEDYEIDIPLVWTYLGQLIGATAFDGILPLHEIHKLTTKYVTRKRNGAKLFAQILLTAKDQSSPEDVTAVWQRSNVPFDEFFDSQEDAIEFVKEKNIEFALGQASSAQSTSSAAQHTARIQEELRTLILKRKARNEEVFDWIDQNVQGPDTKDKPFIRTLVTAVCEQTLEKEQGGSCKCNSELLKDRKAVLQRYIDGNAKLELQALYAVQALFVSLDHPPGFMKSFFDCLYDEEVITEDSYLNWEKSEDPQEQNGKGVARTATSDFFQWLKSASEESGEDS